MPGRGGARIGAGRKPRPPGAAPNPITARIQAGQAKRAAAAAQQAEEARAAAERQRQTRERDRRNRDEEDNGSDESSGDDRRRVAGAPPQRLAQVHLLQGMRVAVADMSGSLSGYAVLEVRSAVRHAGRDDLAAGAGTLGGARVSDGEHCFEAAQLPAVELPTPGAGAGFAEPAEDAPVLLVPARLLLQVPLAGLVERVQRAQGPRRSLRRRQQVEQQNAKWELDAACHEELVEQAADFEMEMAVPLNDKSLG